jgi:hypothetical protein
MSVSHFVVYSAKEGGVRLRFVQLYCPPPSTSTGPTFPLSYQLLPPSLTLLSAIPPSSPSNTAPESLSICQSMHSTPCRSEAECYVTFEAPYKSNLSRSWLAEWRNVAACRISRWGVATSRAAKNSALINYKKRASFILVQIDLSFTRLLDSKSKWMKQSRHCVCVFHSHKPIMILS